jgi:hypothetical protein
MAGIEMRKGFVALRRTTGKMAWVRVDEISCIFEGEEKRDGKPFPILTIQVRNNVSLHVEIAYSELIEKMRQAASTQMHVIEWVDPVEQVEFIPPAAEVA